MLKKILVPIDGSDASWNALDYASQIGAKFSSELLVINVVQPFYNAGFFALPMDSGLLASQMDEMKENAQNILNTVNERIGDYPAAITTKVETGHPSEQIIKVAQKEGCDTIVIGSRGLSGVAEFVLGSVSSTVAQYAKIPVIIVKSEKKEK